LLAKDMYKIKDGSGEEKIVGSPTSISKKKEE
jgi:hypothetical protein